jgi:hypothetical protein
LNDATDRKLVKPLLTHLLFVAQHYLPLPERRDPAMEQGDSPVAFPLLAADVPARAPPAPLFG